MRHPQGFVLFRFTRWPSTCVLFPWACFGCFHDEGLRIELTKPAAGTFFDRSLIRRQPPIRTESFPQTARMPPGESCRWKACGRIRFRRFADSRPAASEARSVGSLQSEGLTDRSRYGENLKMTLLAKRAQGCRGWREGRKDTRRGRIEGCGSAWRSQKGMNPGEPLATPLHI